MPFSPSSLQLALAKYAYVEPEDDEDEPEYPEPCQPLPSAYAPTFGARLLLATVVLLHALLWLMQHWSVDVLAFVKFRPAGLAEATHAKVSPIKHQGKRSMVPLARTRDGDVSFVFQKHKYLCRGGEATFNKVTCPADRPLRDYLAGRGLASTEVQARTALYGPNKFVIQLPTFKDLYIEGLLSPFTTFQFFCILLWCLDEYWQYSVFTLFMMLMFEGTVVMSRRKNIQTLSGMNNAPAAVPALRDGAWRDVGADELVPGDLVSITRGKGGEVPIPCDCLLLRGSAVVNEATLTGAELAFLLT